MENKSNNHIRFSVTIDKETNEIIENIVKKTNSTKAEVTRDLIKKSLSQKWHDENSDMLAMLVKKQVDLAMKVHVERLAALNSKAAHMSARSAFLNAQALSELVDSDKRRDVKELWESSSKKAVEYMKKPIKKFDDLNED